MAETENYSQERKSKTDVPSILMVGSIGVLVIVILWARLQRAPEAGHPRCHSNLRGLAKALMVYARDDIHGRLPDGEKWCDSLVGRDYATPRQFCCNSSDTVEGESDYAINEYAAGKELAGLPSDVVLLFETDFGKESGDRQEPLWSRAWYRTAGYGDPNRNVYKNRWNQCGGPEILTTQHHYKGCYVAFVSVEVQRVEPNELPKLKWKADGNDK
jgi:hypothetical protein